MATLHPGVYVQEIPNPAKSIEGVSTSTAIFVGETERGPLSATKITSRSDYERLYGGYLRVANSSITQAPLAYAMDAFFKNVSWEAVEKRIG